jgi:hypothetical protein
MRRRLMGSRWTPVPKIAAAGAAGFAGWATWLAGTGDLDLERPLAARAWRRCR